MFSLNIQLEQFKYIRLMRSLKESFRDSSLELRI